MRRWLVPLILGMLVPACRQQHPVNVYVNPRFNESGQNGVKVVEKIAVLDCASSLAHADDPDNEAPKTFSRYLVPALQARNDYKFIAPGTVTYAIDKISNEDAYAKFLKGYAMSDKPDMAFLKPLAAELQCDAFLIPVVDLWQKDEVDAKESSTPATYVGGTITVVGATDGAVLFRCTDEDYVEGQTNDPTERELETTTAGHGNLGAKTHRAPPFEDVAAKVAASLASGLPTR